MKNALKILYILCITLLPINIYGQDYIEKLKSIRTEVSAINRLVLSKKTYSSCKQKIENAIVTRYSEVIESVTYIYFDLDDDIRKSVHMNNYPEYIDFTIHYYNKLGDIIYTITREESALNPALVGVRALNRGIPVYTDIQLNDDNNELIEAKEFYGGDNLYTGNMIYNIKSAENLKEYLDQTYQSSSPVCNRLKVYFNCPISGEQTVINVRKVNVHKEPDRDSKITSIAGLGTNCHIVQVEEVINLKGEFWALVNYSDNKTGYLLGDYLEPVERIIEE